MNIEELLDRLDDMLDKGIKIPGKKSVLDVDAIRAVVDEIRLNTPNEIKQARGIVADRAQIITDAKREADTIVHNAETRAESLCAQEEITRMAQQKASEIIAAAQARSKEMRKAAQDFVDDIMRRSDESLTSTLTEVRRTRAALKQQTPQMSREENIGE